jgi:mannose-6-phosphate isomerase-like protein (cupin superfamily)
MSDFNPPCCVKIITINPHSRLSLQRHRYRSERWRALDKGLIAVVGGEEIKMRLDKDVFVDALTEHRIVNPTDEPLRVLELMFGLYDEDDITRIEDDYERV